MSNKKEKKSHGGARIGAGRPKTGGTKVKVCVSVDPNVLQRVSARWTLKIITIG